MSEQEREHEAARIAMWKLEYALKSVRKRQYCKALSWINDAEKSCQEAFDSVLKRGAPNLEP